MEWNPDPDALGQILALLRESQSPDTLVQQSVQQVNLHLSLNLVNISNNIRNYPCSCIVLKFLGLYQKVT